MNFHTEFDGLEILFYHIITFMYLFYQKTKSKTYKIKFKFVRPTQHSIDLCPPVITRTAKPSVLSIIKVAYIYYLYLLDIDLRLLTSQLCPRSSPAFIKFILGGSSQYREDLNQNQKKIFDLLLRK